MLDIFVESISTHIHKEPPVVLKMMEICKAYKESCQVKRVVASKYYIYTDFNAVFVSHLPEGSSFPTLPQIQTARVCIPISSPTFCFTILSKGMKQEYINQVCRDIDRMLISDKYLTQIPVQRIDSEESIICIGKSCVEVDNNLGTKTVRCVVCAPIGIGISNRLHKKLCDIGCKQCPKRLKCALIPQECTLGWLINGAKQCS